MNATVNYLPPASSNEVEWLAAMREQAFEQLSTTGLPSARKEEWRYTNVSAIEKKLFSVFNLPEKTFDSKVIAPLLANWQLPDCYSLVLVDGVFVAEFSNLADLPVGVTICSLADALEKYPEKVHAQLNKAIASENNGFLHFNNAYFTDGVFLHVAAKIVLDKPMQILQFTTQANTIVPNRHLLVLDENAEASVIETFVGLDDSSYFSVSVLEAFVGQNADLSLYKVQCESENASHFGGTYIKQAQQSRFTHHNYAFGGLLVRNEIHSELEQAAECYLNGLYLGNKRQHIDNHTRINHAKPYGISRELYKGVLNDRARGVFQGRVIVAENAYKTDSQMNNRNLLLSNDAEADTKPQLEIYNDDVKCGHGVTVGQLNESSIFYLQSRGMDLDSARNMLIFAFANEMVDKINIKELHDKVLEQLLLRFPQQEVDKEWL